MTTSCWLMMMSFKCLFSILVIGTNTTERERESWRERKGERIIQAFCLLIGNIILFKMRQNMERGREYREE